MTLVAFFFFFLREICNAWDACCLSLMFAGTRSALCDVFCWLVYVLTFLNIECPIKVTALFGSEIVEN